MGKLHNTYIDSACNYIVHALNAPGELMARRHTILNRMLIIMVSIFALVTLIGAASATDYYVATWGDNTAQGNFTHPWQNVSYATQQAVAGDTIYLFNGTWYNETCDFANSGNATHPITLTAYNGTPTMRGDGGVTVMIGIKFYSYTTISHLTMANYTHCIQAQTGANYSTVSDCDLGYTNGTNYGYVVSIAGKNCHYNTIENCSLHDSGWNTVQTIANREPPNGNGVPSTHITVRNCTIYNSTMHNAIDLYGNLQNVTIEDNELYSNPAGCVFTHDRPDYQDNITIRNNYFHDTLSDGIRFCRVSNCDIYNNTFENIPYPTYSMYFSYDSHDIKVTNNSFYNCMSPRAIGGYNFVFDRNYIHTDSGAYMFSYYGSNGTVRNPLGKKQLVVKFGNATADMEFDDGTLFTATFGGALEYTPVRYYPDKSNCSITSVNEDQRTLTATTYNITLRPTYAYLHDVTVDTWDEASDTYRITASSTQRDNPTWVNLTTKSASATYNITRDGEPYTKATTGADGVLRYRYTGTWDGPQTFEFSYASDGADPAPLVTNLRNDAPTQQTVNLLWDCSAPEPDIDYYTIYKNGALLNTTGNKYYSATNLSPDTIYIFNVSATTTAGITGDSVSITVRTAAEDNLPTARAGSDQTVNVNSSVTLDGSASTGDGITSYAWDFDSRNGIQQDATDAIVTHIYTGPGTYIATLTVTDTSGQTDSDTVLITVIEGTTQTTDVSRITNPIVPDGSLSEWAGADTVTFAGSDNTVTVSLTWDTNNLYFGFDVTDTNLQASGTDEADSLHLDDSIEIYLDTNHNGGATMQVDDYHFIINLNGALVDDQGTGSGKNYSWTSHINYAIDLDGTLNDDSDTDNGYVIEVAIPWSDIGDVPVAGDIMGLDLAVNDNDGTAVRYFDWCNLSSWAVPDGWGDATFVGDAPPTITSWSNNITNDSTLTITISESQPVRFTAAADQPITTWTWHINGTDQHHNHDNLTASWNTNGTNTVTVTASNTNGISPAITWTIHVNDITAPPITNLHNDTPTQNSVNLTWDCPAPDVDHYTIHKNSILLTTTRNKHHHATDLLPDTTYIFSVSATDDNGNIGENASITVRTAKATTHGVTISQPANVTTREGVNATYRLTITNTGNVPDKFALTLNNIDSASAALDRTSVTLTAGESGIAILNVTSTTSGTYNVTVTAASSNASSTTGYIMTTVTEGTSPVLSNPSANPTIIPDDTDGIPSWGETSQLNITATDDVGIANVTIDLSPIGGSSAQPMNPIGDNIWSASTSAPAGTLPQTYNLQVTATDTEGKSSSASISLRIVMNGDVNANDAVTIADAMLLTNYVSHPGYTIISESIADVTGDGEVNNGDALLLDNYVADPDQYPLR